MWLEAIFLSRTVLKPKTRGIDFLCPFAKERALYCDKKGGGKMDPGPSQQSTKIYIQQQKGSGLPPLEKPVL